MVKSEANKDQIGGDHYKGKAIEPWDYIVQNKIPYLEGNIIRYASRWRDKGGIQDLMKMRHYVDKLIETEMQKPREDRRTGAAVAEENTKAAKSEVKSENNIFDVVDKALQSAGFTKMKMPFCNAGLSKPSPLKSDTKREDQPPMSDRRVPRMDDESEPKSGRHPIGAEVDRLSTIEKRQKLHRELEESVDKAHEAVEAMDDESINFLTNSAILWSEF